MSKPIPKKITELDKISDISLDDLLLVSDYEGGKCLSKRMTMQQLVDYVISKVKASKAIDQHVNDIAAAVFNSKIGEGVVQGIKDNTDLIVDLLDKVEDQQVLIDGGGAGEHGPGDEQQGE